MSIVPGSATPTALCLPFPLRATFIAQVLVPRDMTYLEAERLVDFVRAIAMPEVKQSAIETNIACAKAAIADGKSTCKNSGVGVCERQRDTGVFCPTPQNCKHYGP